MVGYAVLALDGIVDYVVVVVVVLVAACIVKGGLLQAV